MFENQRLNYHGERSFSLDGIMQNQISALIPRQHYTKVLDYGAGNMPYRHLISCDEYIGVDISQNINGDIDHLIVPGDQLPLTSKSFDLIIILDVLEHVQDPDFILSEIRRLIKPNGCVIITTPFLYREHEMPNDFVRYTSNGIIALLNRGGASIVKINKLGNVYYTLLSLFLERGIANGEVSSISILGRLLNRAVSFLIPIAIPILRAHPKVDDGIFHHLLIECTFP